MKKNEPHTPGRVTLAAIDIGSNAVRLLIKRIDTTAENERKFRKVLLLRVPLRLGFDVFSIGKLSKEKAEKLERLMKGFRQLMIIHDVDLYRGCATSAMRDAKNGRRILQNIEKKAGIRIDLITGQEEARIIYSNHLECLEDRSGNYMYVDVGGGSTEVNLLTDGELKFSASYNIGTIRLLNDAVSPTTWKLMTDELIRVTDGLGPVNIIGTGGNINKLYRLSDKKDKKLKRLPVESLRQLYTDLSALTVEARADVYDLKEDRADVIVPAAQIFLKIAETVHAEHIHVPVIGLADGIIDGLYGKEEAKENLVTESQQ